MRLAALEEGGEARQGFFRDDYFTGSFANQTGYIGSNFL
jgi:hypothetical protein